jgi:hypothetical protein
LSAPEPPPDPREIYRAYVADWDRYIAPADRQAAEYAKLSVEYGKLALQSAFILNGGAIIAVASLVQNLHDIDVSSLVQSAIWFIAGLTSTAIATALAYYNFAVIGEVIILQAHCRDYDLKANYGYGPPKDQNDDAKATAAKVARRRPIITGTMVLAIVFGILAYAFLSGGALSIIAKTNFSRSQVSTTIPSLAPKQEAPKPHP